MTEKEELKELVGYWFQKSRESMDAACDELQAGQFVEAIKLLVK